MTLWDQLHDQLTTMDTLAEHHLWVTTEEIMALLRLDPRPLVDAQGNVTPEFGWRNFRMSQVKYAGNGQHLWRVVNHEKPAAPAPAETVEPVSGTPASAIVHYGFLTAAQRFDLWQHIRAHDRGVVAAPRDDSAGPDCQNQVLPGLGDLADILKVRLQPLGLSLTRALGIAPFVVTEISCRVVACADGIGFTADGMTSRRHAAPGEMSFLYFLQPSDGQQAGGELVKLDSQRQALSSIACRDNMMVFFDSRQGHEFRPVGAPGQTETDNWFALVGGIHGSAGTHDR